MDELIKAIPSIGGTGLIGLAMAFFWRLYREERREKVYWREKALRRTDIADDYSLAALEGVKAATAETNDERKERLNRVVDILSKKRGVNGD